MKAVGITITLDEAGRVALPPGVREALRLSPCDCLEIAVEGDTLSLRPHRNTLHASNRSEAFGCCARGSR